MSFLPEVLGGAHAGLLADNGITDDLFALVEAGEWTLDKLTEYAAVFYSDANGNGEKDFDLSAAWRNDYLTKNNTNWSSYVAKNQEKWQTKLDEMYEALQ